MTTLDATPAAGHSSSPDTDPFHDRGRTTLEEHAVERIAAQAASEVDGIGGSAHRVLGVAVGAGEPNRAARVTARLDGGTATLDVRLSVTYPASVAGATERAREHLIRRTRELTGLDVSKVDITVTGLHGATAEQRRVR